MTLGCVKLTIQVRSDNVDHDDGDEDNSAMVSVMVVVALMCWYH